MCYMCGDFFTSVLARRHHVLERAILEIHARVLELCLRQRL